MVLEWSNFKIFADIQKDQGKLYYLGDGTNTDYYIWTQLSSVLLECRIDRDLDDNSDFETNYKSFCNNISVETPGLANYKGKRFSLRGYKQILPFNQISTLDILLPNNSLVFGGSYSILEKEDISLDDYIKVFLVIDLGDPIGKVEFATLADTIYTRFFPTFDIRRKDTGELVNNSNIYIRIVYNNQSNIDLHLGFTLEVW